MTVKGRANADLYSATVAIETDYEFYSLFGSRCVVSTDVNGPLGASSVAFKQRARQPSAFIPLRRSTS